MSSRTALTAILAATLLLAGCTASIGVGARQQVYSTPAPAYVPPPQQQRPVEIIRQSGNGWTIEFNSGNGACSWNVPAGGSIQQGEQARREADQACNALGAQYGFRY